MDINRRGGEMVRQSGSAQRREDYEEVASRRNPYLVDYEEQRSRRSRAASCDSRADQGRRTGSDGRVRIQKLDCGENRTAPGRRPIAYGSRMAGSGRESSYDNRTAGDSRFAARAKEKQQSAGEWRISGTDDWAEHCPAGGTGLFGERHPYQGVCFGGGNRMEKAIFPFAAFFFAVAETKLCGRK